MDIVIISEFCEDFSQTDNGRFFYLAKLLSNDNEVEIITSTFRHETKKHRIKPVKEWPFRITFIEEPGYSKNICIKRFFSHFVWGKGVVHYIKTRKKPDVIYCAVPSLTGPNLVARYSEKNAIRFVIDVQDLWPEAYRMIFHVPVISNIVFAPFTFIANGIYRKADAICAVSDTYCRRALKVNKKCVETTTVFLGTELETFDQYAMAKPILEKGKEEIWIAYCGTLGKSYDLTCVIDALEKLKNSNIRFIIMGEGPQKMEFIAHADRKGINATFTGRLQYNEMCSLLKICDIAVNPITHMAAQSIINKHADYASSGLPVISTQENDEYKKLIDEYKMGFNCKNNDAEDVAAKLKILVDDVGLRDMMSRRARKCAEEKFDRTNTYHLLKDKILIKKT